MRKGNIFIFLGKDEDNIDCFNFLINNQTTNKIISRKSVNQCIIIINDYCIHIVKTICPLYYRGHRPEISYISNSIDVKNQLYADAWEDIYIKTKMYSIRKQSVRFIHSFEDIDIQELVDDNYALKNTIDHDKLIKWHDFVKRCK